VSQVYDAAIKRIAARVAVRLLLLDQNGNTLIDADITPDYVQPRPIPLPRGVNAARVITVYFDGHWADTTDRCTGLPAIGRDGWTITMVLEQPEVVCM
jgi:hypothetical protein